VDPAHRQKMRQATKRADSTQGEAALMFDPRV
jgi:hypothetical protein